MGIFNELDHIWQLFVGCLEPTTFFGRPFFLVSWALPGFFTCDKPLISKQNCYLWLMYFCLHMCVICLQFRYIFCILSTFFENFSRCYIFQPSCLKIKIAIISRSNDVTQILIIDLWSEYYVLHFRWKSRDLSYLI